MCVCVRARLHASLWHLPASSLCVCVFVHTAPPIRVHPPGARISPLSASHSRGHLLTRASLCHVPPHHIHLPLMWAPSTSVHSLPNTCTPPACTPPPSTPASPYGCTSPLQPGHPPGTHTRHASIVLLRPPRASPAAWAPPARLPPAEPLGGETAAEGGPGRGRGRGALSPHRPPAPPPPAPSPRCPH